MSFNSFSGLAPFLIWENEKGRQLADVVSFHNQQVNTLILRSSIFCPIEKGR